MSTADSAAPAQEPRLVSKAVIPAAGLGTRFLPATKAIPKEMLPVVDMPSIQYVVNESVAAGIDDILLVTGASKTALEDHFDTSPLLEQRLRASGDEERAAQLDQIADLAWVHYVRQGEALGLGHAVLTAAHHVGNQPFAVLLGDDLVSATTPVLPEMLKVRDTYGGSVIALMEVPPEEISRYGCAAVEPIDGAGGALRVTELVEKPEPGQAPSNYAVIGRYVLDPAIFPILENQPPGRGGEIQLTDALRTLALDPQGAGGGVRAVVFSGDRYDVGDKLGYLQANVRLASERTDLGEEFRAWLREYVASERFAGLDD